MCTWWSYMSQIFTISTMNPFLIKNMFEKSLFFQSYSFGFVKSLIWSARVIWSCIDSSVLTNMGIIKINCEHWVLLILVDILKIPSSPFFWVQNLVPRLKMICCKPIVCVWSTSPNPELLTLLIDNPTNGVLGGSLDYLCQILNRTLWRSSDFMIIYILYKYL